MGWNPLKKVKKTLGGIAKNPLDAKNYVDLGLQTATAGQVDTDGINGVGSFSDVLLGKKQGGKKADAIAAQIKATQGKGLGELNAALDTPSESIVREQAGRQTSGVLTAAQDARRNAQRLMAQRGLQNSSLGLAANRSITQQAGNDVATIEAQLPGMIRNQKIQDAQTRINAGGLSGAQNIQFQNVPGQRSGGILGIASALAPVAGTVAGAYFGGPAGAAAGGGLGKLFGSQDAAGGRTQMSMDYLSGRTGGY